MLISFIVCTSNRPKELEILFKSIITSKNNFKVSSEVIVVDQSSKKINKKLVKNYNFTYLHSRNKGLSASRNIALKITKGDFVAFLDDDCYLDVNYFKNLKKYLNYDFISARILTIENKIKPLIKYQINKEFKISKNNFDVVLSSGLIFRSLIVEKVGFLDEEFGIGAKYGASEEADYVLRFLKFKFKGIYTPKIQLYHPKFNPDAFLNLNQLKDKFLNYGKGRGALLLKHSKYLGLKNIILQFLIRIFLIIYSIFSLNKYNFFKNINLFKGMCQVYFK